MAARCDCVLWLCVCGCVLVIVCLWLRLRQSRRTRIVTKDLAVCHAALAVEVWWGTLPADASPAGNTVKRTSRLRSAGITVEVGGEHCHPELAVEDNAEAEKDEKEEEKDGS